MERLERSVKQLKEGKGKAHELIEVEDWRKFGQMKLGKIMFIGSRKTKKLLKKLIVF